MSVCTVESVGVIALEKGWLVGELVAFRQKANAGIVGKNCGVDKGSARQGRAGSVRQNPYDIKTRSFDSLRAVARRILLDRSSQMKITEPQAINRTPAEAPSEDGRSSSPHRVAT